MEPIIPPTLAELQACRETILSQIDAVLNIAKSQELSTMKSGLREIEAAIKDFSEVTPATVVEFSYPPTAVELEACRRKLIEDIEGAKELFGSGSQELRVVEIGLKQIEEMLGKLTTNVSVGEKADLGLMDTVSEVVMIADSDIHVRKLLSRFLIEAGYAVTCENDGYAALDKARLSPPLAILADVLLPKLDGLALCRLIKGDPAMENNVTVIVFSVLAAEERALKAGADAFIRKPLEKVRLLTILEEAKTKRNLIA